MSNDDLPSDDELAHRQPHPLKSSPGHYQRVQQLVERLLDLEARTHPENAGPGEKELDSIFALAAAGELIELLAGWAMDHRAGIVANGVVGYPWPNGDTAAATAANDHRNEEEGSRYLKDRETRDPNCDRAIISDVAARAPILPSALHLELSRSLDALRFGTVYDILKPTKITGAKGSVHWALALRAIEHVHYLMGRERMDKSDAVKRVAGAYGIPINDPENSRLKDWEYKTLKRHFGSKRRVEDATQQAERLGQEVFKALRNSDKTQLDEQFVKVNDLAYGEPALQENGRKFQELFFKGRN